MRNKIWFDCSFVVNSRGLNGGLAFLWNSTSTICLHSYSQNHISIVVTRSDDGKQLLLIGFYENPSTGQRSKSWRLLRCMKPND